MIAIERAGLALAALELELGLIQTQMAQKPVLRADVYVRALCVSQYVKRVRCCFSETLKPGLLIVMVLQRALRALMMNGYRIRLAGSELSRGVQNRPAHRRHGSV